jgi:hypothetical protein
VEGSLDFVAGGGGIGANDIGAPRCKVHEEVVCPEACPLRSTPTRKPRVLKEGDVVDGDDHSGSPWNHKGHREVRGVEEVGWMGEQMRAHLRVLRRVVTARPDGRPHHAGRSTR